MISAGAGMSFDSATISQVRAVSTLQPDWFFLRQDLSPQRRRPPLRACAQAKRGRTARSLEYQLVTLFKPGRPKLLVSAVERDIQTTAVTIVLGDYQQVSGESHRKPAGVFSAIVFVNDFVAL